MENSGFKLGKNNGCGRRKKHKSIDAFYSPKLQHTCYSGVNILGYTPLFG